MHIGEVDALLWMSLKIRLHFFENAQVFVFALVHLFLSDRRAVPLDKLLILFLVIFSQPIMMGGNSAFSLMPIANT